MTSSPLFPPGPLALAALAAVALLISPSGLRGEAEPLPGAHAHNDYEHPRPLFDALGEGFTSVEADVYLRDGRLLVAHDPEDLRPDRTLRSLYLDPLRVRTVTRGGSIHGDHAVRFHLLIDIKSEAGPTYAAIDRALASYPEGTFTRFEGDRVHRGAVTVIISGNRPREAMLAQAVRHAGYDGRLADLDAAPAAPPAFMPWVSDRWGSHFRWRGEGDLPAAEAAKLADIVERARAGGYQLRFWAIPDREEAWRTLAEAGVDWINTDRLAALRAALGAR